MNASGLRKTDGAMRKTDIWMALLLHSKIGEIYKHESVACCACQCLLLIGRSKPRVTLLVYDGSFGILSNHFIHSVPL